MELFREVLAKLELAQAFCFSVENNPAINGGAGGGIGANEGQVFEAFACAYSDLARLQCVVQSVFGAFLQESGLLCVRFPLG